MFWNIGIAEYGYAYRIGSTAFHPLYPLLIGVLGRAFGGDYLLAGWLIAQVCCVAMLALLVTVQLVKTQLTEIAILSSMIAAWASRGRSICGM